MVAKNLPMTLVEVTKILILVATRMKGLHLLSHADAFVVVPLIDKDATIVTSDPEFKGVYPNITWIKQVES